MFNLDKVTKLHAELCKELHVMSRHLTADTEGMLALCTEAVSFGCDMRLQMFSRAPYAETLARIKGMADDAAVTLRWAEDDRECYYFNIDRHPFCIVIDK